MLSQLQIENIGIIEKLSLDFEPGLNVLTGETGAGKSIIISAFSLILGERVKPEVLRHAQEEGRVVAIFQLPEDHPSIQFLKKNEIDVVGGELLVKREVNDKGRNKCSINGQVVTLMILKEMGNLLVDIHGTFDHQKLLQPETHVFYLDQLGVEKTLLEKYKQSWEDWNEQKKILKSLQDQSSQDASRAEFLKFQLEELSYLEKISITEEELEREHHRLSDVTRLLEISSEALQLGSESEDSLVSRFHRFQSWIKELSEGDSSFVSHLQELESLALSLGDTCEKVSAFQASLVNDPERLQELDEHMALLRRHKTKYGLDFNALKTHYTELKEKVRHVSNSPDFEALQKKAETLENRMRDCGERLSQSRVSVSIKLKTAIETELEKLGMPHARFFVKFAMKEPSFQGLDQIEFFLLTNPGEKEKPLMQIASGGELCRIMLAFKAIFAEFDDIPILVFDEIDANIGGVTSVAAAKKMSAIAKKRQVITITHQPQIAARAAHHFAVAKVQSKDSTRVFVKTLNKEERVDEIARMLGGSEITKVVKIHAQEMIAGNTD
jgi:DNA repair protein RecN (Recombination protein N)